MARIKLSFPAHVLDTVSIPVRITDINYGNHVGNDAFAGIIHEARMQWLRRFGYTELQIEGVGLIMSDLAIEYKNESFYGDIITVQIGAGEISGIGFELYYRLETKRKEEIILLALAKTGMVCYNYAAKKAVLIPEKLRLLLTA